MSATARAIFVSYTSQDADAARRLCDALRAAGLEVWFDQSELRGGDAWDASIRRQIKECALFVPVISANTESRTEGYFRLEWRLAEQRSHLMAKGRPFLVPVVIDATSDTHAHVPDAFLEVQWSRIPAGRCGEKFADRARQLLSWEAIRSTGAGAASQAVAGRRELPRWLPWLAGAVVIAAVGIAAVSMTRQTAPSPVRAAAAPAAGPAAELVAKARALLDDDPLMTRRNIELAEQLALDAIARDPTDAEAFAAAAWANFRFLEASYEDTPKRRADLRSYAEKAKLLAADSINAELAACGVLIATKNLEEAVRRLVVLADRAPGNLTVLRTHAWLSVISPVRGDPARTDPQWRLATDDHDRIIGRLRAHSPLGRSYADSFQASIHWGRGEFVQGERLLDGVFASGRPVTLSYLNRLLIRTYGWGDLPAARDFAAGMPSKLLLEDVFITHASNVWLWSGDHEQALQTLGRTQREMLHEALIRVPAAMLRGHVLSAAGKPAAAAVQWREALKVVDRLLLADSGNVSAQENRKLVLALLGDRKAAAAQHAMNLEMRPVVAGSAGWALDYEYHAAIGDVDGAILRLDRLVARDNGRWPQAHNALRFDPSLRALRADPRAKGILRRGEGWLREMREQGE